MKEQTNLVKIKNVLRLIGRKVEGQSAGSPLAIGIGWGALGFSPDNLPLSTMVLFKSG